MASSPARSQTDDVELVERESALAELAGLARRARAGKAAWYSSPGRRGSARPSSSSGLRATCLTPAGLGAHVTGCSRRVRSVHCSTSPRSLAARSRSFAEPGAGRDELFGALLRQVSEPGALDLVVIEDVHWADEATIDLLSFLGRRLKTAPGAAHRQLPG